MIKFQCGFNVKEKCCSCKHIFPNFEYDGLLDCDIASEDTNKEKCCNRNFDKFEYEPNEKIRKDYLLIWKLKNDLEWSN